MFEELVPAIASAISAQGSELVIAGGKAALRSLYEVIHARFGRGTPAAETLDAALAHPDDSARVDALARSLADAMARDPDFARQIVAAWQGVNASDSAVVNNFSGRAEQVVQARTVRGGIKF